MNSISILNEFIINSLRAGNNLNTSKDDEYENYAYLCGFVEAEKWQTFFHLIQLHFFWKRNENSYIINKLYELNLVLMRAQISLFYVKIRSMP